MEFARDQPFIAAVLAPIAAPIALCLWCTGALFVLGAKVSFFVALITSPQSVWAFILSIPVQTTVDLGRATVWVTISSVVEDLVCLILQCVAMGIVGASPLQIASVVFSAYRLSVDLLFRCFKYNLGSAPEQSAA